MEELCKKFPKICNCPYKEDIDKDLKKGKTAYYISKWLSETECPISYDTLRKYQKYLIEIGEITTEQKIGSPSHAEDNLLTKLEKKATDALESLDMENVSDNVKVQLILGACKLIYGNKHLIDANLDSQVTMNNLFDDDLIDKILDGEKTK
ncbi:MAG: hypothetical protein IKF79_01425 [Methanosphaera sp.]|nr:hypothetical protein [Methanosphaera sp.]